MAQPPRPAVFGGTATLDGEAAADRTVVSAWIDGVQVESTTVSGGYYAFSIPQLPGESFSRKTITFMIGDFTSNETEVWESDGGRELNLTADSGRTRVLGPDALHGGSGPEAPVTDSDPNSTDQETPAQAQSTDTRLTPDGGDEDLLQGSALVSYQFSNEALAMVRAAVLAASDGRVSGRDLGAYLLEAGHPDSGQEFADCRFLTSQIEAVGGYWGQVQGMDFDKNPRPFEAGEDLPFLTPGLVGFLDWARETARSTGGSPVIAARHFVAFLMIDAEVRTELEEQGVDSRHLRESYYFEVTRSWPDDDLDAWKKILLGPSRPLVASYSADTTTGDLEDKLDVERYAEALASVICSWDVDPPLSIGVFGDWGSGKSFFMQLLKKHIDATSRNRSTDTEGQPLFCEKVVNVEFNAWHYVEADLWASLVQAIFQTLGQAVSRGVEESDELNRVMKELGVATEMRAEAQKRLDEATIFFASAEQTVGAKEREYSEKSSALDHHSQMDVLDNISDEMLGRDVTLDQAKQVFATYFGVTDLVGEDRTINTKIGVLAKVLSDDRVAAARARTAWQWLANAPIDRADVVRLAVVTFGLLAVGGAGAWALRDWVAGSWTGITTAVAELGGMLTIGIAWARKHLKAIDRGLNQWDSVNAAFNARVKAEEAEKQASLETERNQLKLLLRELEKDQEALAEAERRVVGAKQAVDESTSSQTLARFIEQRLTEGDYAARLGIVAKIRDDFQRLSNFMLENRVQWVDGRRPREPEDGEEADFPKIDRIVLFIDDLDRCRADRVVKVLEAIHLLLAFPLFVVVVGVDLRWAAQSLHQRFPLHLSEGGWLYERAYEPNDQDDQTVDEESVTEPNTVEVASPGSQERASALDYLEKIFQIPFWLPPMSEAASKNLIAELVPAESADRTNETAALPSDGDTGQAIHSGDIDGPSPPPKGAGTGAPETPQPGRSTQTGAASTIRAPAQTNGGESSTNNWEANPEGDLRQLEETTTSQIPLALKIQPLERLFLLDLAGAVGRSPRRLKRFVNTYRMLKAASTSLEKEMFVVGDGESGEYRAAMSLLALVTGAPHHAPMILSELLKQNDSDDLSQFVRKIEFFRGQSEDLELEYAVRAMTVYQRAVKDQTTLRDLRYWAVRVTRFSFRSGRL